VTADYLLTLVPDVFEPDGTVRPGELLVARLQDKRLELVQCARDIMATGGRRTQDQEARWQCIVAELTVLDRRIKALMRD